MNTKTPTKSPAKPILAALTALIIAATGMALPHLKRDEGLELVAYQDVAGVWTICYGETAGVKKGDTATPEQCEDMLKVRTLEFTTEVAMRLKVPVSPQTLNALARFSYNIGITAFSKSTVLRKINAGDVAGGCTAMLDWKNAGYLTRAQQSRIYPLEKYNPQRRRNCSNKLHGCPGMWNRRLGEVEDCMAGIGK